MRIGSMLLALFMLAGYRPVLGQALQADLYVSTIGNDGWTGRLAEPNAEKTDGPVATVAQAQALVRKLRGEQSQIAKPVVVALRGGFYSLGRTLRFGPEDSGDAGSPTIYTAYGDERPILSGGTRIEGWQGGADGRWQVTLPDVADGKWGFAQLFVNDQRRFRPRLPKQGYFKVAEGLPPSDAARGRGFDRFVFAEGEVSPDWSNLRDVEMLGFHVWCASRLRVESVDSQKRTIQFTGATRVLAPWLTLEKNRRYRMENVKESLTEPGEWYLDRPTGVLTYIPRNGETPATAMVVAPRIARLIEFSADVKNRRFVNHLEFRGLTFAHSNWELPGKGQSIPQGEVLLPAAIEATGTRNLVFDRCTVRHTGGYGISLGMGCCDNRIEYCELVDLGAGGVMIGTMGGDKSWGPEEVGPVVKGTAQDASIVARNTVQDCTIAHGGRMHPAAVGVWIGHASENTISHNDIFDFYYTGISVGWQWGYAKSRSSQNQITFNHLHTLGQKVLSDLSGVYTLGMSPGTVVSNNLIHDVQSFDYGGWGLYTDEGSSGITMENNLVYRTKTGGFHQHYGRENRIENNIFAFGDMHQLQRTRVEPHTSFMFERNIVYWDTAAPLFDGQWRDPGVKLDHNLYWSGAGEPIDTIDGLTFEEWQAEHKQDKNSRIENPQFVDPTNGDYRLKPESPATQLGFIPFDYSKAGRETAADLNKDLPPIPKAFE